MGSAVLQLLCQRGGGAEGDGEVRAGGVLVCLNQRGHDRLQIGRGGDAKLGRVLRWFLGRCGERHGDTQQRECQQAKPASGAEGGAVV